MPPSVGATETFGDPSVGVDRHGVFYFANLAADAIHGHDPSEQVHRWWKYLGLSDGRGGGEGKCTCVAIEVFRVR
jgi:hypothetical protein